MRMNHVELSFILVCMFVAQICAHSTSNGKGVYKTYNTKKSLTAAAATKNNSEKFLFNSMNNDNSRAPLHDTPTIPCQCSKYLMIIAITGEEKYV